MNKRFSLEKPLFWAFLLPVGLILVYNTGLLVFTLMVTCKGDSQLTR